MYRMILVDWGSWGYKKRKYILANKTEPLENVKPYGNTQVVVKVNEMHSMIENVCRKYIFYQPIKSNILIAYSDV